MDSIRVIGLDTIQDEMKNTLELYVIRINSENREYFIFRRFSEIKELYYIQLRRDSSYFSNTSLHRGLTKDIDIIQDTLDQIPDHLLSNFKKPNFNDISLAKSSACVRPVSYTHLTLPTTPYV